MTEIFSFGEWVRRRCKALDLTQDALARQAGCALSMIRKIEADERRPSRQIAELLAAALAVPATERDQFLRTARAELAPDQLAPPVAHVPAPIPGPSPATVSTSTAPIDDSPATIRDQPSPSSLPSGTVTFLFTDLVGSTRLWEQHPQAMQRALEDATQLRPDVRAIRFDLFRHLVHRRLLLTLPMLEGVNLLVYILVVHDCLLGVWLLVLAWR